MTAARLVAEYDTWLVLRLVQVADTLLEDSADLARRTGFAEAWAGFEAWPEGAVGRATQQPLLDRWVGTAERLVAAQVHRRYPDAHPSRHLQDFGRLLLSWAADAPDGSAGQVPLLGRRCFPLLHGRLMLRTDRPQVGGALRWVRSGRTLEVSLGSATPVAAVDLDKPDRAVAGPVVEPDQVVRAAYRDLWLRWTTLAAPSLAGALPASPLSDLRTSLAEQGAERYLRELHAGRDPGTGPQDLWPVPAAAAHPEPEPHDRRLLLVRPAAPGMDTGAGLDQDPAGEPRRPGLVRGERAVEPSRRVVAALPRARPRHAPAREGAAFSAAAAAYVLADWSTCLWLLERCLRADPDVEEYRYLRAFALRHAGDAGAFDCAVFSHPGALTELVRE